ERDGQLRQRAAVRAADEDYLRAVGAGARLDRRQALEHAELERPDRLHLLGLDGDALFESLEALAARDLDGVVAGFHVLYLLRERPDFAIVDVELEARSFTDDLDAGAEGADEREVLHGLRSAADGNGDVGHSLITRGVSAHVVRVRFQAFDRARRARTLL